MEQTARRVTCPYCGVTSNDLDNWIKSWCDNCEDWHENLDKGTPLWVKKAFGRQLWIEDDARPPDAEHIREAWLRLFHEPFPEPDSRLAFHDAGDAMYSLYDAWRVACISYPGESAIYQLQDRDTFIEPETSQR